MLQYSNDAEGWLPAKGDTSNPYATPGDLAQFPVQQRSSSQYGPDLSGIIRDVIERRHTRESGDPTGATASPQYLPDPKILLCPSDRFNNPPNQPAAGADGYAPPLSIGQLWPTQPVLRYTDLPRTAAQANTAKKSYTSFVYIALLRNDDRGDFFLMGDQTNTNDAITQYSKYWTPEDNHGQRGINAMFVDSHVEWTQLNMQVRDPGLELAIRLFGTLNANRARYNVDKPNRASEIVTVE